MEFHYVELGDSSHPLHTEVLPGTRGRGYWFPLHNDILGKLASGSGFPLSSSAFMSAAPYMENRRCSQSPNMGQTLLGILFRSPLTTSIGAVGVF